MGQKAFFIPVMLSVAFVSAVNAQPDEFPVQDSADVIAYCCQPESGPDLKEIYTINADGTGNKKISNAAIGLNEPDWSPDAQKIAAVGYVSESTRSIHVFNADDGSGLIRLTDTNGVWDTAPSWLPDGKTIAFTRIYPDQNNREELWIMDSDGSNQHGIDVEGGYAKWSPDGTRLVYHSCQNGNYDVYTCNPDGTDEKQITATPIDEVSPAWSPDGAHIAFTAITVSQGLRHDIYVMDSNGTNLRCLTDNENGGGAPRWSPDGSRITFHSGGEVHVINLDGTDLRRVTDSPTGIKAINPVWRPISNSGIDDQNSESEIPEKPELFQNHPNPFGLDTSIQYTISGSHFVSLKV